MKKHKRKLSILATGADIKSRFCVFKDGEIFVSQAFGNLENPDNFRRFKDEFFSKKIKPDIVAYDLHPAYFSSRFAIDLKAPKDIAVQHHHAHIASMMFEKNIKHKVIGVAFDGTGYGSDGNFWGGEFLCVDAGGFRRIAHFDYMKLPGGEAAITEPWRIAFSILYSFFGEEVFKEDLWLLRILSRKNYRIIIKMLENNINTILTSSVGRLFDAVSSILWICKKINFEAQLAIKLEKAATKNRDNEAYDFDIIEKSKLFIIGYKNLFRGIILDLKKSVSKEVIARRFHNSLANLIDTMLKKIYEREKVKDVILSGGVFQNRLLYGLVEKKIKESGFNLLGSQKMPVNDLGICYGQLYVALNGNNPFNVF